MSTLSPLIVVIYMFYKKSEKNKDMNSIQWDVPIDGYKIDTEYN